MSKPTARAPVVLVIDDEPVIRDVIRSSLEVQGFTVVGAASGVEAIQLARAHRNDLCLALIELCLSDGDGPALAWLLRLVRPGLPCGYITWGAGAPAAPLLRKPFSYRELIGFVGRLLADRGRPAHHDGAHPVVESALALCPAAYP